MQRKLLFVSIDSITLNLTGEPPNVHDESIKHAVMATLIYPRSGAPTVTSALTVADLVSGDNDLSLGGFSSNGLFKEEVQDSTLLNLTVVNRQQTSDVAKFLLGLFATILGAGIGVATGGLTGVLGAVSAFGVDAIKGGIKGAGDDEVITIGSTNNIPINIAEIGPDPVTREFLLVLTDPVVKRFIDPATGQVATLTINPGQNGTVRLTMRAEDF